MGIRFDTQNSVVQKQYSGNKISFKGTTGFNKELDPVSKCFNKINSTPIIGLTVVDALSMDLPRSACDFISRNINAGIETFIRESSAILVMAGVPIASSFLLMQGHNAFSSLKINPKITADNETLDILKNAYEHNLDKNKSKPIKNYVENVLNGISGLVGDKHKLFKDVPDNEKTSIIEAITEKIHSSVEPEFDIHHKITSLIHADQNIKLTATDSNKTITTNLKTLLNDTILIGQSVFKHNDYANTIERMKTLNKVKIGLALTIASSVALSVQFMIREMTRRRTGIDKFVGIPDYNQNIKNQSNSSKKSNPNLKNKKIDNINKKKEDKSLNLYKKLLALGIVTLSASTIAGSANPVKIIKMIKNDFLLKMKFDGLIPNINQCRVVYSILIAGRLLAARDKNELRETTIRDYNGFLNWLVLGGIVSKGVASLISKGELLNGPKNNILKQSLKSHSEVLVNFTKESKRASMLKKLNIANGAGLLYSILALGIFVPMLNKYITNKLYQKKSS